MREKIERYARRLEGLSIEELSESAEKLVSLQRRNDAALIAHLVEISRRRGHLELGYKNLFDYCQERLRLGDGGAVWCADVARDRSHPSSGEGRREEGRARRTCGSCVVRITCSRRLGSSGRSS